MKTPIRHISSITLALAMFAIAQTANAHSTFYNFDHIVKYEHHDRDHHGGCGGDNGGQPECGQFDSKSYFALNDKEHDDEHDTSGTKVKNGQTKSFSINYSDHGDGWSITSAMLYVLAADDATGPDADALPVWVPEQFIPATYKWVGRGTNRHQVIDVPAHTIPGHYTKEDGLESATYTMIEGTPVTTQWWAIDGEDWYMAYDVTNLLNGTPFTASILASGDFYFKNARLDLDYKTADCPSPVPVPAAAWLFGSALLGFVSLSNRRKV